MQGFWGLIGVFFVFSLSSYAQSSGSAYYKMLPHPPNRDRDATQTDPAFTVLPSAPVSENDEVSRPQLAEKSEVAVAKGVRELNSGQLDAAEKYFRNALALEKQNFIALEYLGVVFERKSRFVDAIAHFARAKRLAPKNRLGLINFQIGRLYMLSKNYVRAEIYFRLCLEQEGQLTFANYALGYLLYIQKKYLEAEKYFHASKMRLSRAAARESEVALRQAVDFYLGEIYARLGFEDYAIASLRETEFGESWELRNAAWRVHSELNRWVPHVRVAFFVQADSNVLLLPREGEIPIQYAAVSGFSAILLGQAGVSTSPAQKWVSTLDASYYMNNHVNSDQGVFDLFQLALQPKVRRWNQKNLEGVASYSFSRSWNDRASFRQFQTAHGPHLHGRYFPSQRWNWELGFDLRFNSFPQEAESGLLKRTGGYWAPYLRLSQVSPNPRLRPGFEYKFSNDFGVGEIYRSRAHQFGVDAQMRLFEHTHLNAAVSLALVQFPQHPTGRSDTRLIARLGLVQLVHRNWSLLAEVARVENASNFKDYSYRQTTVSGGVSFQY